LTLSFVKENHISLHNSVLSVLKVLEQLPEGLAVSILAASTGGLDHHLSILPSSLHHIAIEAAFPEIRLENSLDLDLMSMKNQATAYAVLNAATAGKTGPGALGISPPTMS
jgi:hypothetical protein